jgi:O-succinylbenzoate synthase
MYVSWHRYSHPLAKHIDVCGTLLHQREGLIVEIQDGVYSGRGECAPLPGLSSDSLDILEDRSKGIGPSLTSPFPLLQYAMDMAMWNLNAARQRVPLHTLLKSNASDTLHSNALLSGSDDDIFKEFELKKSQGYVCFKVKLGRRDPDQDIALVHQLALQLPKGGYFRLDANRAWDLSTACRIAEAFQSIPLAYIEEPLSDPHHLPEFCKRTGLKVALDESIYKKDRSIYYFEGLAALIIKPTLLESLPEALYYLNLAKVMGISGIVSSCFETAVGLDFLRALSQAFSPGITAGLDG